MGSSDDRARVRGRLESIAWRPDTSSTPTAAIGSSDEVSEEVPDGGAPEWLADTDADELPSRWLPERWRGARLNPGRPGAVALAVVGVVAALVAVILVWRDRPVAQQVPPLPAIEVPAPSGPASVAAVPVPPAPPPASSPPAEELVVSVVGLVGAPGLVRLSPGSRVADALTGAGGTREGADLLGLNLAQRVGDGDQIVVGAAPAHGPAVAVGSTTIGSGAPSAGGSGSVSARASGPAGKLDLNAATEAELDGLPGVGPVTAAAIVAWRQLNGRFTDVEQLGEVDGIGPARLEKLRALVTV